MKVSIRRLENLHIALWLVKDMAWISEWRILGSVMVLPAVFLAFNLTWLNRKDREELFHNLAVCCWIIANSIWMIGEFFYGDSIRGISTIFFVTGLGLIAVYYLQNFFNPYFQKAK